VDVEDACREGVVHQVLAELPLMVIGLLILALLTPSVSEARVNRWKIVKPYNAKLERMANCESTKRWFINTGNGYFGGLQFNLKTWRSVGGRGYPHQNSIIEQKYRAVKLIKRRGYQPWPRCGYA